MNIVDYGNPGDWAFLVLVGVLLWALMVLKPKE
jgi:hypothetical protein